MVVPADQEEVSGLVVLSELEVVAEVGICLDLADRSSGQGDHSILVEVVRTGSLDLDQSLQEEDRTLFQIDLAGDHSNHHSLVVENSGAVGMVVRLDSGEDQVVLESMVLDQDEMNSIYAVSMWSRVSFLCDIRNSQRLRRKATEISTRVLRIQNRSVYIRNDSSSKEV